METTAAFSVGLAIDTTSPRVWTSGQSHNQTLGQNAVSLQVKCDGGADQCASEPLRFYGATLGTQVGQAAGGPGGFANVTIDDVNPVIYYDGFSSKKTDLPVEPNAADFNATLSGTTMMDAMASVQFIGQSCCTLIRDATDEPGSSIVVHGAVGPDLGAYRAILDGTTTTYTASSAIEDHGVPLFFAAGLDPAQTHTLMLVCLGGGAGPTGLVLDAMTIWGPTGSVGFA